MRLAILPLLCTLAFGAVVRYTTFLGGASRDLAAAVAVDSTGDVYVTGYTVSTAFPTTVGAYQRTHAGVPNDGYAMSENVYDSFVTKLSPDGSSVVYSTFLGGSRNDMAAAIVVDNQGNAIVGGRTNSRDFPCPAPGQGFVTRLNAAGSALLFSTCLPYAVSALAVDAAGNIYAGGGATITRLDTGTVYALPDNSSLYALAVDSSGSVYAAGAIGNSGFVTRMDPTGKAVYAASLPGPGYATTLALDRDGSVLVAGVTTADDFPVTTGAYQTRRASFYEDAFIARINSAGAVTQATFLGGGAVDSASALAVAGNGAIVVTGATLSSDFPVTLGALQPAPTTGACAIVSSAFPGSAPACSNAFLAILDSSLGKLLYSTYRGGLDFTATNNLALAPDGSIYLSGSTGSSVHKATCTQWNSPTYSVQFPCDDALVMKIDPAMVYNAITGIGGALAPGEFVSLYGTGIGPKEAHSARFFPDGRLSTSLDNVSVLFDGIAAPLLYAGPDQINAIVPFAVAGKSAVTVRLSTPAASADLATVSVVPTAPALIGVPLNQDLTENSDSNPAARGSIVVLYAAGAGQTSPAAVDGRLAIGLSQPLAPITLTIGGCNAQVLYAGAAPTIVEGVIQINAVVPEEVVSGARLPVVLTAGAASTQQQFTVAVD